MIFRLKKGAMFGLDARIALSIFGALSVISGAALYSAIQKSKTAQWNQYFVEIAKATEQYYLDNVKRFDIATTTHHNYYISDISVNREGLSTWKGPYWNAESIAGSYIHDNMTAKIHSTAYIGLHLRQASTWSAMDDTTSDEFCVVDSPDCAEWIFLGAGNAAGTAELLKIFEALDEHVDGGDGALAGIVRYNTFIYDFLMYRGMPRKRT